MASAQNNTCQKIQVMIAAMLFCSWITGTHGVSITNMKTNTLANNTDPFVILPCNFTTNSLEAPRITWFRYRGEERVRIMRFENNRLFSYQELSDRVARGDKGALVLIRPSVKDTGRYSCEVEVERERPGWVKSDLYLNVTRQKVTVTKTENPIRAADTDVFVTLPCDYRTNDPTPPRITWDLVKGSKDTRDIAVFNKDGGMSVSDQFVGRVARGNRGDLVLISPRVEDSGTFKCTIQVDNGNPVTADVKLLVSRSSKVFVSGTSPGVEIFICILWIIPVFCGFVFEERRFARIIHMFRTMTSPKQLAIKGWRYIVIVLALCLIFSGTASSAKALSSGDPTDFNYNRAVGYGTGITGIVILCGAVAFINVWKAKCSRKETTQKSRDHTDIENVENSPDSVRDKDEPEQTEQMIQNDSDNPTTHKEEPKIVTIGNPGNWEVTGITVFAQKLYMTTHESLYRLNPSSEGYEHELELDLKQKYDQMMVSQNKHGPLLLGKRLAKRPVSLSSYDKYTVMSVRLENKKKHKVTSEQPISCVFSQLHSEDIYVTFPNIQRIRKTIIKDGQFYKPKDVNTSVLKHPTCIAKNSRDQIIVTDSEKNDVFVFNEKTGFVTSMKISVPKDLEPELQGCNRLAVGADDRIYVTGPFTRRVFVFGADFRFERVIETGTETSGQISCLMVHENSLYMAHSHCIRIRPLADN